jgi:uncharacterized membrane protein YccC
MHLKQSMFLGYVMLQLSCFLQCMVFAMLLAIGNVSLRAEPSMAVFFISLMSCFPNMLFRHFLNDFEMVPFVRTIIGITSKRTVKRIKL